MISLNEYARNNNVSYESIRRSVGTHAKELEGHVLVIKRTRYLDDEGVKILNEIRADNPVVLNAQEKKESVDTLQSQVITLQNKILELEERLNEAKDQIIERDSAYKDLQQKYIALLEPPTEEPQEEEPAQETPAEAPETPQKATFGQRLKFFFTGR